jgi:hypothetical protein
MKALDQRKAVKNLKIGLKNAGPHAYAGLRLNR